MNVPSLKEGARKKREVLLRDKMDVREFIVDLVENYSHIDIRLP
jgi:hypothetical protein